MINFVITHRLDLAAFAFIACLVFIGLHLYLKKITFRQTGLPGWAWLFLPVLIVSGYVFTENAATHEGGRLQKMLQGFAPTYATEMRRMGHSSISASTDSADSRYLTLIDAEKDWLKANPIVNDIYTFGKLPDGKIVLLVDSETDYDRNGVYSGEREVRTPIGEVYEEVSDEIRSAFEGRSSFAGTPYTDRWGTWVSAFEPILDEQGNVTAVLGVDYSASEWIGAIFRARLAVLGFTGIILVLLFAFLQFLALMQSTVDRTKHTSDALRDSEARFRFLAEAAPIGIYQTDIEGRCIYANPGWLTLAGLTLEKTLGEGWASALHPDDSREVFAEWQKAVHDNKPFSMQFRFQKPNGEICWIESKAQAFRDSNGKILGYIGIAVDITERKKLEAQLLQSQKMETVGTLAGGVAHDLNNQITPMVGYIDLLLMELEPTHPSRALVQEAATAAKRCTEIVQRLMNFARPSTQKRATLDMRGLLEETRALLLKLLPATISLETSTPADLWPTQGNETEIQSVLINLSTNARDAMPNGGRLRLTAANQVLSENTVTGLSAGKYVCLTISDTGSGIAPEIIGKIFEPFFTTKTKGQGTGLGLAMVFSIVKNHGGRIEVHSELGKGTSFEIYLPVDTEVSPAKKQQTPAQPAPLPQGQQEIILVAEDEASLRNMAKTLLERLNYRVLLAVDGAEAVSMYQEHRAEIAAVLMDMTMPKLKGRLVIQEIIKMNPSAKIVVVSGYTAEGSVDELLQEGAFAFIQKPYTIEPIARTLHRALHP